MGDALFDELVQSIISPVFREVKHSYRAQLNYPSKEDAFQVIYQHYSSMVEEFKGEMLTATGGLDIHKNSACLCGAIVKSRALSMWSKLENPVVREGYERVFYYPNELFAVMSAMQLIKTGIITDPKYSADENAIRVIETTFPYFPSKITDKHTYLSNIIYYINKFMLAFPSRLLFDYHAYSLVFYHLDRENRARIEEYCDALSKNKPA